MHDFDVMQVAKSLEHLRSVFACDTLGQRSMLSDFVCETFVVMLSKKLSMQVHLSQCPKDVP